LLSANNEPTASLFRVHLGTEIPGGSEATSPAIVAAASRPFILYISTLERRKNHELLYRALRRLAERHAQEDLPRLIFVGSLGWGTGELLNDIALDPLTQGLILVLDGVSDSDLKYLYQSALFCVFPSLYEGWGIPVAEALALGKPVICSNQGSIPEVGGDLVEYLDPWDLPSWVNSIEQLWLDTELRKQRAARILHYRPESWSTTAREFAEAAIALESHASRRPSEMGARGV
jgi:glycosyltransferase involved in cell wall biosynthesis